MGDSLLCRCFARSLLVVCLILLASSTHASELDLTVEVPAGKFQCFFQTVDNAEHKTMEIDYQVRGAHACRQHFDRKNETMRLAIEAV